MTTKLAKLTAPIVIAKIGNNKIIRTESARTVKWFLQFPCTSYDSDHSCLHLKTIDKPKNHITREDRIKIIDENIIGLETARFEVRTASKI